jgi:glycosyltransferase involved in cell wall biosynthesis
MSINQDRKKELKFIYWFAHYSLYSPSVRYRGKYPLDHLKNNFQIRSYFSYPSYKPWRMLYFINAFLSALLFRKSNSIIVVQRLNSNFIYANLLKLLVKLRRSNTVYDIDDADYLEYPPATIYFFSKNCSKISVGSHELVKNLSKFNDNIILNTSSTPELSITKKVRSEVFTIGWIGGFGGDHKKSLMTCFFPSLKDMPFKVKLVLLGVAEKSEYVFLVDYFRSFQNIILEMPQDIDWNNELEIQDRISKFDVGIATLVDNEMQRSKSAFKTKQYMNNGVPVLSVDIPENNLFINDGKDGFLCNSPDDFRKRIIEIQSMDDKQYQLFSDHAKNASSAFSLAIYCDKIMNDYMS